MRRASYLIPLAAAALAACSTTPIADTTSKTDDGAGRSLDHTRHASILTSSVPADGSTVKGPVEELKLRFAEPVRLMEVTMTGPDGSVMPIMVTAVGELREFSVPVSAIDRGTYKVVWRGTAKGAARRGASSFTVT